MSITRENVTPPTEGINVVDSPTEIGDLQAIAMTNLRQMGNALESVRPMEDFVVVSEATAVRQSTDDVLVYRKRDGTVAYMFVYAGAVWTTATKGGTPTVVHTIGDPTDDLPRTRLVQFGDVVYILNGGGANKTWDGITLRDMGIVAPDTKVFNVSNWGDPATHLVRDYYYTYYNETLDLESNPSPVTTTKTATAYDPDTQSGGTIIDAMYSADPQVTHIRVYRTGEGITVPRRCTGTFLNYPDGYGTNHTMVAHLRDNSTDAEVAEGVQLSFDHDKPPLLADGLMSNNRLFGIDAAGETLWISNEYHPDYMPIYPFTDQEHISSGGPIQIAPGDGGKIRALIPYGGAMIALKDNNIAYLVQESEVGFYGYQRMSIPGVLGDGRSAVMTPWGLVYLARTGYVLVDANLTVTDIGEAISPYTTTLDPAGIRGTIGYVSSGYYIASMPHPDYGWLTFLFNGQAWSGPFSATDLELAGTLHGSSFYEDVDGALYAGRCGDGGMNLARLADTGLRVGLDTHESIDVAWIDKPREFVPDHYARARNVFITAQVLTTSDTPTEQSLDFVLRDGDLNELERETFVVPIDEGRILVPLNSPQAQFLSMGIEGQVTSPIRISKLGLAVEPTVVVQGE